MITEAQFQVQVKELARMFGWDFLYHAQLSKWSEKGWPDLCMVRSRDHRLLFAELKSDKGKLSERQDHVLAILRTTAAEVYVWRPADLEQVAEVLR